MGIAVDVVVVGAGPVGLLTAIELALGGVRVLILERLSAPSTATKAKALGPLASEALQRRGMTAAIVAEEMRSFAAIQQFIEQNGPDARGPRSKLSGHFAGLPIRKDAQNKLERRARAVDQHGLEAMLAERARSLGIEVRRACEVIGFAEQDHGIDVEWSSPAGGGHIRCSYLIGCDGGRSFVRKRAGFDFPGTQPTSTLYQVIADIDHPERLLPNGWNRTPGGVFSYGPIPGRLVMIDFSGPPEDREAPLTREEIEAVLRRISGKDVGVKSLESGSRWADNTRLVDTYRKGRVLLAGDAAHIHTPFGGQGLSLGLVDAANLGWKLAAVIRGEMPESLLDTYTAERRPVAEAVLANTLAQMAIMRPDPQSGAMRDIVARLMQFDDVNRFIGEIMSGLSIRYDLGSKLDDIGRLIEDKPIRHGDADVSLYDLMQDGMAVLLDASTEQRASKLVAVSTQRIRCVVVDAERSMLIRPDACIAWTGEENSIDGLDEALRRWFKPTLDVGPMA
ncbi:FAD-dependent oxidoreductase [Hyphomicrobium sp. 99]|uniref:FAD-dependent oxidoreductase n=1 Tax=Hyphomicrobium sp. 99 TaxID=1163419 RepID=UPI0005F8582F|nr:FAD-dependent oxidoreductase [Hyphomicrobium sp. 99]